MLHMSPNLGAYCSERYTVEEMDYDEEAKKVNHEFYFSAQLDKNGDLTGNCRIKHPSASRNYDGPLPLLNFSILPAKLLILFSLHKLPIKIILYFTSTLPLQNLYLTSTL